MPYRIWITVSFLSPLFFRYHLPLRRPGFYESVYWPLSQLCSMWSNIKGCNLVNWEATFPLIRWSTRLTFSQSWVCRTLGIFLGSAHSYLLFWLFVFWSWLIFFSSDDLVWIGWFSNNARRFYHSCRSWVLLGNLPPSCPSINTAWSQGHPLFCLSPGPPSDDETRNKNGLYVHTVYSVNICRQS